MGCTAHRALAEVAVVVGTPDVPGMVGSTWAGGGRSTSVELADRPGGAYRG